MNDEIKDDEIESLYMNEWLEFSIAIAISSISFVAFFVWIGYMT